MRDLQILSRYEKVIREFNVKFKIYWKKKNCVNFLVSVSQLMKIYDEFF